MTRPMGGWRFQVETSRGCWLTSRDLTYSEAVREASRRAALGYRVRLVDKVGESSRPWAADPERPAQLELKLS